jgi:hypothetical protein
MTVDEMYQHFKARMMDEVVAEVTRYRYYNDNNPAMVGQTIPLKNKGE